MTGAGRDPFRAAPWIAILLFIGPVVAGLLGTLLPAMGWTLPAGLGQGARQAWIPLLASPELPKALALSCGSALLGTMGALLASIVTLSGLHGRAALRVIRVLLLPLMAVPHLGTAVGLAFLLAPSGWIARLLAPVVGWSQPPDVATVQDSLGLALAFGLAVKEMPFLTLALIAASGHIHMERQMQIARSLGYGPASAWLKVILPQLYPQIRLPVLAVLAYGLSVVDVAVVLGPASPPPLSPLLWTWFNHPDLALRGPAAAGSLLLLLALLTLVALWRLGEVMVGRLARAWLTSGAPRSLELKLLMAGWLGAAATIGVGLLALIALAVWAVAGPWPFPTRLPTSVNLLAWARMLPTLTLPLLTTAELAIVVSLVSLVIVIGCIEHEALSGPRPTGRVLGLVYLPLLVPQVSFLFGFAVLLAAIDFGGNVMAVAWAHFVFVLPYVLLMLREAWLALDPRLARAARALGKSPWVVLWHVKLPILVRPVALAFAVGVAVSTAQYLSTLFAGGGRVATLSLETLALASSGDRRSAAVAGLLMTLLPLLVLGAAAALPRLLRPSRQLAR